MLIGGWLIIGGYMVGVSTHETGGGIVGHLLRATNSCSGSAACIVRTYINIEKEGYININHK